MPLALEYVEKQARVKWLLQSHWAAGMRFALEVKFCVLGHKTMGPGQVGSVLFRNTTVIHCTLVNGLKSPPGSVSTFSSHQRFGIVNSDPRPVRDLLTETEML